MSDAVLSAADALREARPEDALDTYLDHEAEIAVGDARVRWILAQPPRVEDPRLAALLTRVAAEAPEASLRREAAYVLASRVRLGDSERWYRAVLAEPEGRHDDLWRRSCVNLAQQYRLQGRLLEALVLAGRAADVAREAGDDIALAAAYMHRCAVLFAVGDRERYAAELTSFGLALERAEGHPHHPMLALLLTGYRAQLADLTGAIEEGLALYETFDRMAANLPGAETFRSEAWIYHARLLTRAGDFERAGALLLEARRERVDASLSPVELEFECLRLAQAQRGAVRSLPQARALLRLLDDENEAIGAGMRFDFGARMARLLRDEEGAGGIVREALELASQAALERILELDRRIEALPAEAEASPADHAVFAAWRTRFQVEHEVLLATIAEHLHAGEADAAQLLVDDGWIAVCAWCQRVRTAETRWLPLGSFLPRGDQVQLTHTICPPCRARAQDGAEATPPPRGDA